MVTFQDFRCIMDASSDAISLMDSTGEVLYANPSTMAVFGYRPDELVGSNGWDRVHPDDRQSSGELVESVIANPRGTGQWPMRIRHKDGTYLMVESAAYNLISLGPTLVHQRARWPSLALAAEQERHTHELACANTRLEDFVCAASHDLREPLMVISRSTEMLVAKTKLDADTAQLAKFIVNGVTRMSALIADLLSFATTGRQEPGHSLVNLRAPVAQAMLNLAPAIESARATVIVDELPMVRGNESQLARLFQNLMSNALKYRSAEPVTIRVSAHEHGSEWIVRVEDNGIGIATTDQARIFAPFVRLGGRDVAGTGLGLALCKKIIEAWGGAIWVESAPGSGSTFCFTIPQARGELVLSSYTAA